MLLADECTKVFGMERDTWSPPRVVFRSEPSYSPDSLGESSKFTLVWKWQEPTAQEFSSPAEMC